MSTPRIPSQREAYGRLMERLDKYAALIEEVYDDLNDEAAKAVSATGYDGSKPFRWKDYPQVTARVEGIESQLVEDIQAVIDRGTSAEWKESDAAQDLIVSKALKSYGAEINGKRYKVFYQTDPDALKAFQTRKDNGMGLSDKLWSQAKAYREELEAAISCAIRKGTSAVTLSKRLSKYLLDLGSIKRDYKELFGKATDIHDCEYRSARLARTEINMAYRTAENVRWRNMDFVVGYEVKTTRNGRHEADVCDDLAGKYPKDFEWVGWHPNCMCYKVPILKTDEEFWAWDAGDGTGSVNEVKGVPENFTRWVRANEDRISAASSRGTTPYFIRDNMETVKGILGG